MRALFTVLLSVAALPASVAKAEFPVIAVLKPETPGQVTRYASHIGVDANRVIVGAAQGAFLYSKPAAAAGPWLQEQFLKSPASVFGAPVSLRGDIALFGDEGAYSAAQQAGAAKFWRRAAEGAPYQLSQTVWPADSQSHDEFGSSLVLGDGFAFIGADNDSHNGKQSTGTVTLYREKNDGTGAYEEVNKFAPADLFSGSDFGDSMDLDVERLVVGASGNGGIGAAYVYERNAGGPNRWAQVAKLEYPGRSYAGDVAIDDNTILVSRPGNIVTIGLVDVYDRDPVGGQWVLAARLIDPANEVNNGYGASVALSGNLAVISSGHPSHPDGGRIYVYGRHHGGQANWGLLASLTAPEPQAAAYFGSSVAIMDHLILVGSLGIGDNPRGSVYVFAVPEPSAFAVAASSLLGFLAIRRRFAA